MLYLFGTDTPGGVSPPPGDLCRNRRLWLAAECGMVRDVSGVIRYAISDGHGSGSGYLGAIGWCACDARATLHTLGTFIYFLYTSSKIAYLGSYTYNTTLKV